MREGLWMAVLMGCSQGTSDGEGDGGRLILTDEHNYTYFPTLEIADVEVQSQVDSTIDWSALTTDHRGRPLNPAEVEQVYLVEFRDYTQHEIEDKLEVNELYGNDIEESYIFDNVGGVTRATMSAFEILSDAFDPETFVENASRVWLVSLINHPGGANDVLQYKFVTPLDTSTNTSVTFTNDCSTLHVEVNMDDPIPPVVPTGGGGVWTLDWSAVTVDMNGRPWEPQLGDNLQIGHFDAASVSELEAEFLRLDIAAVELYTLDVFGSTAEPDLAAATDTSSSAFPGFTTDGIWVVAITCTTCLSPAPLYLAVVEVQ